jgi:hypothetical protein
MQDSKNKPTTGGNPTNQQQVDEMLKTLIGKDGFFKELSVEALEQLNFTMGMHGDYVLSALEKYMNEFFDQTFDEDTDEIGTELNHQYDALVEVYFLFRMLETQKHPVNARILAYLKYRDSETA